MDQVGKDFDSFKNKSIEDKDMSQELHQKTDSVKQLIDTYDQLSQKLEEVNQAYEEKAKTLFDTDKVKRMKDSITKIKSELFEVNVQIGVYRGQVVKEQIREGGDAFEMYKNVASHQQENNQDDSYEI